MGNETVKRAELRVLSNETAQICTPLIPLAASTGQSLFMKTLCVACSKYQFPFEFKATDNKNYSRKSSSPESIHPGQNLSFALLASF